MEKLIVSLWAMNPLVFAWKTKVEGERLCLHGGKAKVRGMQGDAEAAASAAGEV